MLYSYPSLKPAVEQIVTKYLWKELLGRIDFHLLSKSGENMFLSKLRVKRADFG